MPDVLATDDEELLSLADFFGTPLYVFDGRALAERIAYLRTSLTPRAELCYAMKANPFVLGVVEPLVSRLEVCSPGELRICRSLGIANEKLVISGVYKEGATVTDALGQNTLPAAVTVESLRQLDLLEACSERLGVSGVCVLLRLSSGSQFGMNRQDLLEAARRALTNERLAPIGIQLFTTTQKRSLARLRRELDALEALAHELSEKLGWAPEELEVGPGLPVSYFEDDDFDEPPFLASFAEMLKGLAFDGRIMLELGRSMVASCGTYLTRVVDEKVCGAQSYALVDGGMHHVSYYGQSMAMRLPPVRLVGKGTVGEGARRVTLCGALCTTNDLLAKQVELPGIEVGDVVAFGRTGAYSMTEGISLFLSRDLPAIVGLDAAGTPRLLRDHTPTDPLNTPIRP